MPRPPHRNKQRRRHGLIALLAIVVLSMVAGGCYYGPDHPRRLAQVEPPYQNNSTPGTRVIVYDGDGEAQMKLRVRSRRTRVYDASMIPVGQVRPAEGHLEKRSRDGKSTEIVKSDRGGGELPKIWQLSRDDDQRWTIADGDGTALADLVYDDQRWFLKMADESGQLLHVDHEQTPPAVVTSAGDPILTVPRQQWSDPKLLLLTLQAFEPLDRYTLAVFADRRL
jgi:hypothetical protein